MGYREDMERRGLEIQDVWPTAEEREAAFMARHFSFDELEATRGRLPAVGKTRPSDAIRSEKDRSVRDGTPYVDPPGTYGMVDVGNRILNAPIRRWIDIVGDLGHGTSSYAAWVAAGTPSEFAGHRF